MKKGLVIFLAALCFSLFSLPVSAAESHGFSSVLSEVEGREGDTVELSVRYDGSLGEVGAFLVRVEFDPDIFEYQRVKTASAVRDAYSLTIPGEDWIDSGYVMKSREECLVSPGDTFTYRFKVREGTEQGEADFFVSVYQIVSPDSVPMDAADLALPYVVLPPPSEEAALISLTPSIGELEPAFSPEWFSYTVTVPFEVTSMSFFAEPVEGAVCKVNRKNLGAGGSETEFNLTVTAEDGKTKAVYQVMVYREEKAASPKPSTTPSTAPSVTPRPTPTPKPAAVSKPVQTSTPRLESDSRPESSGPPAETAPSSTPQPQQERLSPSPVPALSGTVSSPPENRGTASLSQPSVAVRGGETNYFPFVVAVLFMITVSAVSKPLAKLICRRDKKKK